MTYGTVARSRNSLFYFLNVYSFFGIIVIMDGYLQMSDLLKALGHPVRLRILQVLRQQEACVCHLEAVLKQRQAYISQQLMRLRDAGLVEDRREGMNVFYRLRLEHVGPLLDLAQEVTEQAVPDGQSLRFANRLTAPDVDCSCPKCTEKAESGAT